MLDIVSDPSSGTPEDKMRLFVIYYLLSPDMTEEVLTQHTAALESVGVDIRPLEYLKKWKWVRVTNILQTIAALRLYLYSTYSVQSTASNDCIRAVQNEVHVQSFESMYVVHTYVTCCSVQLQHTL